MLKLQLPKLEVISKNIEMWIKENFTNAITQPSNEFEFKFGVIVKITRVWKNNDCWLVDVFVEYFFPNQKLKTFTFQVDGDGQVIGFDLHEPTTRIVSL